MPEIARVRRALRRPPGYIVRRLSEEALRELDRAVLQAARHDRGPLASGRVAPRNAESVSAANALAIAPWRDALRVIASDPDACAALGRRAERALERRVEVFGDDPVPAGIPPRWSTDIHSGDAWPRGYYRRLEIADLERASDVKVPWELSRLRHVVALAQGSALGSREALQALEDDLADWRRANPVGWSVNWTCAMEVALRAVNLICADAVLLAAGVRWRGRPALVASLYQHGWFLARNLEVSDLNGNHFLADGVGLVWLGRYFGALGHGPRWSATGAQMVRRAAAEQILHDGLDHEGSLAYHVLVLEMFLVARVAAAGALADIDERLVAMVSAARDVAGPRGEVPNLGDDDGGRVLALSDVPSRDARRVLALASALLDTSTPFESAVPDDALWLTGRRPRVSPAREPRLFAAAGLAIMGDDDDHVAFDAGPVGFRGRGGHGHLDAMSFEAVIGGHVAVRDSGTATYTRDPALRNRLRGPEAHSVVVVDGLPYARLGPGLWEVRGDAPPTILASTFAHEAHEVRAVQELPARNGAARHERALTWHPGELQVNDTVTAPAGSEIAAYLHVPAGCELGAEGLLSAHHRYVLEAPEGVVAELVCVPCSKRYGSVGTAGCAVLRLKGTGAPVSWRWRIEARCHPATLSEGERRDGR